MIQMACPQLSRATHGSIQEAVRALQHDPDLVFTTCNIEPELQSGLARRDFESTPSHPGDGCTIYCPETLPGLPKGYENIFCLDYNESWNRYTKPHPHIDDARDGNNRIVALAVEDQGQGQGVLIYLPKSISNARPLLQFKEIYSKIFSMLTDSDCRIDELESEASKLTKLIDDEFVEHQVPTNMIICCRAWPPQDRDSSRLYLPHSAPSQIFLPRKSWKITYRY